MKTTEGSNPFERPGYGPLPGERPARVQPLSRAQSRVLTVLQAESGPVGMADLSLLTGLHANTLREHLEALEAAGRIRRQHAAPTGPGRPPTLYQASDVDRSGVAEYAGLATALASTLHRTSPDPGRDAAEAGDQWGRELAARRGGPAEPGEDGARREVVSLLDEIGFAPEPDQDHAEVRLTRCPLLDTARRYPDVVCAVHLGIVRGALDEYGADTTGTSLHPFSEPGACRLHLSDRR